MNFDNERIEAFETIYGVETFHEVLEIFEVEYNRVKNRSPKKIYGLYRDFSYAIFFRYGVSSIRNNLVKFKNIIKANGGKYEAIALEAFTVDNVYKPLKKKDLKVKKQLREDLTTNTTIINPDTIKEKIIELKDILKNGEYNVAKNQNEKRVRAYYLVAILGLATGRRFTELLKTFKPSKHGTKIYFDGLLKGNNEKIDGNIIELSYSEMNNMLKELRKAINTDNLTVNEVNVKYSKVFNNQMKKILGENTSVKDTRLQYSLAGSQLFKKENETIEETITRILGHKEVFVSALNYTKR